MTTTSPVDPVMNLPFAKPQRQALPQVLKTQMDPYIDYFEAKWKEIGEHHTLPFELDDKGNIALPTPVASGYWLLPDQYMTGNFKDGKRIIMMGTHLGVLASYEVDDEVKVPKDVSETGILKIINYKLHAPQVFWDSGYLKLTMYGKVDISTHIDIFGYPEKAGRDDHNKHNLAKRLAKIIDAWKEHESKMFRP
jgi:hypothetical protein